MKRKKVPNNELGLEKGLEQLGISLRWNVRSSLMECKMGKGKPWCEVNDHASAHIRSLFNERFLLNGHRGGRLGRDHFQDLTDALFGRFEDRRVDPFRQWLIEILLKNKCWDKKDRYAETFTGFDLEERNDPDLMRWAGRQIVLGAVARTIHPGSKVDTSVVLIGPQGIGKSSFCQFLFPKEHRASWVCEGLDFSAPEVRRVESIQGAVIVELAEMRGSTRAEASSIKHFMTQVTDRTRLSYRRNPDPLPRRCIFVGTADNDQVLPNDPQGNRRFVPIYIEGGSRARLKKWFDENREQLWLQAVKELNKGGQPYLPDELRGRARDAAEGARNRDELGEEIVRRLAGRIGEPFKMDRLMSSIVDERLGSSTPSQFAVTRALKHLGYENRRIHVKGVRGRFWVPPEDVELSDDEKDWVQAPLPSQEASDVTH